MSTDPDDARRAEELAAMIGAHAELNPDHERSIVLTGWGEKVPSRIICGTCGESFEPLAHNPS